MDSRILPMAAWICNSVTISPVYEVFGFGVLGGFAVGLRWRRRVAWLRGHGWIAPCDRGCLGGEVDAADRLDHFYLGDPEEDDVVGLAGLQRDGDAAG